MSLAPIDFKSHSRLPVGTLCLMVNTQPQEDAERPHSLSTSAPVFHLVVFDSIRPRRLGDDGKLFHRGRLEYFAEVEQQMTAEYALQGTLKTGRSVSEVKENSDNTRTQVERCRQ